MKKKRALALLCALLLLLTSCALLGREEGPPEGAYQVYFAVAGEQSAARAVDYEYRQVEEGGDSVKTLAEAILSGPASPALRSPVPAGVRLISYTLDGSGRLKLNLSEQYGGLSGMELTVANACLTLTLCQLPGVEEVAVTVEGEAIPYQALRVLRAGDIILSGAEEEPAQITVQLLFPRDGRDALGVEEREVTIDEKSTLAGTVVEALLFGPRTEGLRSMAPEGTELRSARVSSGICYVDLTHPFLDGEPEDAGEARLLLYSLVDTLCNLSVGQIEAVSLLVEGELVAEYGGVDAMSPIKPDYSLAKEPLTNP